MASLSAAPSFVTPDSSLSRELDEDRYIAEVLNLPQGVTENQVDEELVFKANSFGIAASTLEKRHASSALSSSTGIVSDGAFSTAPSSSVATPHSSIIGPPSPLLITSDEGFSDNDGFSQYDKYLDTIQADPDNRRFRKGSLPVINTPTPSVFSISTRKSFASVTGRSRKWFKRKPIHGLDPSMTCHGCQSNISKSLILHRLACEHAFCAQCLRFLIDQAMGSETTMPPRCCSIPLSATIIQTILEPKSQQQFLNVVNHYNTPKESRFYCPIRKCGAFIPRQDIDPKHPFNVSCPKCHFRICLICKDDAHPVGKICPADWELDALLKIGQKPAWQRCYSCYNLVTLTKNADHMICRCKAQLCHVCGGVWDTTTGCPNLCNDSDELIRRRQSEEEELDPTESLASSLKHGPSAELQDAKGRAERNSKFQRLGQTQHEELDRFCKFMKQARDTIEARHSSIKLELMNKHAKAEEKLRERHVAATSALEDLQIAAEMELRTTLQQSERSVKVRLKHMEAYCEGLGRSAQTDTPSRVVTERDLRELGQQYNLRDGMKRLHQAKINVMRERQSKRMEDLLAKQDAELDNLLEKHEDEVLTQDARFITEEEAFEDMFRTRQIRLNARWCLELEVLCKELEEMNGMKYAPVPTPVWPVEDDGSFAEST